MLSVLGRRVLITIPLLLLTSAITFALQALIPGDPARAIVGITGTVADYEKVRQQLHLDLPLWQQYADYAGNAVQGNLGSSIFTGEPVAQTLLSRLPVTVLLVLGSIVVSAVVGVLLGAWSAHAGGRLANVVDVLSLAGLALPNFWLALLLVSAFAIAVPLLPATGYVAFSDNPQQWAASLTLPVVALAIGAVAQLAKTTRNAVADAMGQDYIRTLRSCGVSERSLLWRHALRNAGVPITTVIGLAFVGSLSGSLFVENVFVLPGLGSRLAEATNEHDISVIQGIALAYTLLVIGVNLVVDVAYVYLNPKARTA